MKWFISNPDIIGLRAYKKTGYFAGRIGTIQFSDSGITLYKLVFADNTSVGVDINDLVFE